MLVCPDSLFLRTFLETEEQQNKMERVVRSQELVPREEKAGRELVLAVWI